MDPVFLFKKTLSIFLNPVSITLELVLIGLLLIGIARHRGKGKSTPAKVRFRRRLGRFGCTMVILGAVTLYASGTDPLPYWLTLNLERRYPPPEAKDGAWQFSQSPEFVVVLAGGQQSAEGKPILSSLTRPALARVVGGVDYWKQFPESTLAFTGHPDETRAMRAVAERLGVPADRILEETKSRDTKDHPRYLKPVMGDRPFVLVTSAVHYPRAHGLFLGQGLDPIAGPVDFQAWPEPGDAHPYQPGIFVPRAINVYQTAAALHEHLGLGWAGMRGQLGSAP